MIKNTKLIILFVSCILLYGCSKDTNINKSDLIIKNEITEDELEEAIKDIDKTLDYYDISLMSETMGIATIVSIYNEKEKFIGNKIRITGRYETKKDNNKLYEFIVKYDTNGCCGYPFDIWLKENEVKPNENDLVTVEGVIDTYKEDNVEYLVLRNTSIIR